MFTIELEDTWLVITTVFSKVKDFLRSQAVTYAYTVNVVIPRKEYKIRVVTTYIVLIGTDVWPIE